ncbi:hypothetical protein OAS39_12720 [Pirellulales bacterium]|nr:hypothetical protein [Pirellulales bacterium]
MKCCSLLAMLTLLAGCGSPAVVPTSFDNYNSKGGTFACECPQGWEVSGGGKRGPEWGKFVSGPAEIKLAADSEGSLIADASGGRDPGEELPPDLHPVHMLHVHDLARFEKDYTEYKEIAGPLLHDVKLGPSRISEFIAVSSFGSSLHGYRATVLGKDKRVIAVCICPENQWTALKPAFDKVLASIERGSKE